MSRILENSEYRFTHKNINYVVLKYKLSLLKQTKPNPSYAHVTFFVEVSTPLSDSGLIEEGEKIIYQYDTYD